MQLEAGRQAAGGLRQAAVQPRRARFQRVGHRGPVGFHQNVARQIGLEIHGLHLFQRRQVADLLEALPELVARRIAVEQGAQLRRQHRA